MMDYTYVVLARMEHQERNRACIEMRWVAMGRRNAPLPVIDGISHTAYTGDSPTRAFEVERLPRFSAV